MGSIFGGPTDGDIERAEQRAYEAEQARLRLQEKENRQRQSSETTQGQGIATPGDVVIGSDIGDQATGAEQVEAGAYKDPNAPQPVDPNSDEGRFNAWKEKYPQYANFNWGGIQL